MKIKYKYILTAREINPSRVVMDWHNPNPEFPDKPEEFDTKEQALMFLESKPHLTGYYFEIREVYYFDNL